MVHLVIYNAAVNLLKSRTGPSISRSITYLTFHSADIHRPSLRELSERLPSLNTLEFNNCQFSNAYAYDLLFNNLIDMQFTSFNTLKIYNSFELDDTRGYTQIQVKISTARCAMFYKHQPSSPQEHTEIGLDYFFDATESTEQQYVDGLNDKHCVNFHILCKLFGTLRLNLSNIGQYLRCTLTIK